MLKRIFMISLCMLTIGEIALAANKSCTQCYEEGFNAALNSYKTGVDISPSASCNIRNSEQSKAWWSGSTYFVEYGAVKNSIYYDKLRSWRFMDISMRNSQNTPQSIVNQGLPPESQAQIDPQGQQYQQEVQQSQSPVNTIIDTGVQILNKFIGY